MRFCDVYKWRFYVFMGNYFVQNLYESEKVIKYFHHLHTLFIQFTSFKWRTF